MRERIVIVSSETCRENRDTCGGVLDEKFLIIKKKPERFNCALGGRRKL